MTLVIDISPVPKDSWESSFLLERLQILQTVLLKDFKKRINEEIESVMQELRQNELRLNEFKAFAKTQNTNTWSNRISLTEKWEPWITDGVTSNSKEVHTASTTGSSSDSKQSKNHPRPLPDKVFVTRESYLTALLEVNHMRSIYNIFLIVFLCFFLNTVIYDYLTEGRVYFGLGTVRKGLEKIDYVLCVWLIEHLLVFLLYYGFKMWANVRLKLWRQHALQCFWSHSCLITYISSQLVFGYVASVLCRRLELGFIPSSVLLLESTRLLMKMHAFVRTNAARVLSGKLKVVISSGNENTKNNEVTTLQCHHCLAPFHTYLYFLFAPTLIYRDHYPRTTHIRWKFALARFMEVVAIAFLYSYIYERHIKVHFGNIGREELTTYTLIIKLYSMIMPCNIIYLCGFYLLLHAWLNFTSELLRFGDRMFYKDWWTSTQFDAFYRNWNVVVHDWLYEYIYKEAYTNIFKGSKLLATLLVFYTSAVVHEYIIGYALGFFCPIMFTLFGGCGVITVYAVRDAPKRVGNFCVWLSLILGNTLLFSLYSMEYHARQNCPRVYEKWMDYFVPTMWKCYH
ncbi:sterol O-acyltransferase 1 isoform X2 [Eurosta solidaginis]|uniref:sterol O-acyltransferase 1 isoform X2 n=1 Tax=Eurosta solidaginis TaxID=178769 RepID=UPI0035316E6C